MQSARVHSKRYRAGSTVWHWMQVGSFGAWLPGMAALVLVPFLPGASALPVRLLPAASPSAGRPGVTRISLTGWGFPPEMIPPGNVRVTLHSPTSNRLVTTSALAMTTTKSRVRQVSFQIPSSIVVSEPTLYDVSISGMTSGGVAFSGGGARLTVVPKASNAGERPAAITAGPELKSLSSEGVPAEWTADVLHNFASRPSLPYGADPTGSLIQDSAGNLYGTTTAGGAANMGVVYKLDRAGNQTVLHSFTGGADGGDPVAGVIEDSAGNLYGTTQLGGTAGYGVVFKLNPAGQETVLHSFTGKSDGGSPSAGVTRDSAGNLYGTAGFGSAGAGVIFKLTATGDFTVLYSFTGGPDGGDPSSGVILDSAGNLYGTTTVGGTGSTYTGPCDFPENGAFNAGVVYKLDPANNETVLYSFTACFDGGYPQGNLVRDSSGNLYGTATLGYYPAGLVFEVFSGGGETPIYNFTGVADGNSPEPGLTEDSAGNLYGASLSGGTEMSGVVFEVNAAAAGNETVLYNFTQGNSGPTAFFPSGNVIRDSAGNLYGVTEAGGAGFGAVYKLNSTGKETVLYTFPIGPGDGYRPPECGG